jgi:hypothetical protein
LPIRKDDAANPPEPGKGVLFLIIGKRTFMIISVGEIVWDIFGNKQILGGAPLNVAYHLTQLGQQVKLVSRARLLSLLEKIMNLLLTLSLLPPGMPLEK